MLKYSNNNFIILILYYTYLVRVGSLILELNKLEFEKGESLMEIYRRITVVIACIVAIICMVCLWNIEDITGQAKLYPISEEVFSNLEQKALNVAKTFDVNQSKIEYTNNELIVVVDSDNAKVKAKIPVSIELQGIEEDNLNLSATLNYNETTYERTSEVKPLWQWVLLYSAMTALLAFTLWAFFEAIGIIVSGIFYFFKLFKLLFSKKND